MNLSLQGIDTLDATFDFNALEAKQKLLEKFVAVGKADQVAPAIQAAEQLVEQAVAADEYEIALMLATTASHAVTKSTIPDRKAVEERLSRRRRDIRVIQTTYAAAKKAEEALAKNPADPEANSVVGRWRCLFKQDWAGGLPLLAKGSDETLKSLAEQDLKNPTDAAQQVQLADEWWDLAQKEAGAARDSLHLHAADIYQAALPNLTSALKKAAIGKRLEEVANLPRPAARTPAENTAASLQFPLGQWVDVLRLIDPTRDSVLGTWKRNGAELTCKPVSLGKIALPVIVQGGYDFEVEFTRNSGKRDVVAGLWIGSHPCAVSLSADNGAVRGLMKVNGHDVNSPKNPIVARPGAIENGRRYRLLVMVRIIADDHASIDVLLDDKPCFPQWVGNPADLSASIAWQWPEPGRLGLGANESDTTFHSVRLKMASGQASEISASIGSTANSGPPESQPAGPAAWVPLEVQTATSAIGAVLTKEPDNVVFASGKVDKDTYTITVKTQLRGITAFRLEAPTDPRLPGSGPGRNYDGNFVLSKFRVTAAPALHPSDSQPVVLQNAQADHSQKNFDVSAALGDDVTTGWALSPQYGRSHTAVFECKDDIGFDGGTVLTFSLDHFFSLNNSVGISLGKFRLSATTANRPVRFERGP